MGRNFCAVMVRIQNKNAKAEETNLNAIKVLLWL
jgi:hypothetical protein